MNKKEFLNYILNISVYQRNFHYLKKIPVNVSNAYPVIGRFLPEKMSDQNYAYYTIAYARGIDLDFTEERINFGTSMRKLFSKMRKSEKSEDLFLLKILKNKSRKRVFANIRGIFPLMKKHGIKINPELLFDDLYYWHPRKVLNDWSYSYYQSAEKE